MFGLWCAGQSLRDVARAMGYESPSTVLYHPRKRTATRQVLSEVLRAKDAALEAVDSVLCLSESPGGTRYGFSRGAAPPELARLDWRVERMFGLWCAGQSLRDVARAMGYESPSTVLYHPRKRTATRQVPVGGPTGEGRGPGGG